MNAALLSAGKIGGSVILLAAVLFGVSRLSGLAKADPEVRRKLIHISLGLYCLMFPFVQSAVPPSPPPLIRASSPGQPSAPAMHVCPAVRLSSPGS